jgi:type IV pilus biogenesis protein CpaD/CtpE
VSVQAETWFLGLEEWSRPRSGVAVSQMQPLRNAVTAWEKTPQSSVQIRYPGGEAGSLWAEELSDWLISLGVPAGAIEVLPGSASEDSVEIALSSSGD